MKKVFLLTSILIVLGVFLAACDNATPPAVTDPPSTNSPEATDTTAPVPGTDSAEITNSQTTAPEPVVTDNETTDSQTTAPEPETEEITTEPPKYSERLKFTYRGDGTCYVSGIGNCLDLDVVVPPVSPTGDIVTSIGECAFQGSKKLSSIVLPDSVTSIGVSAFMDSKLSSITIPNSVTSIDALAFFGCKGLTSITLGNGVTTIGEWAFQYCSNLTSIIIPDSVTKFGVRTFDGCTRLTSITFKGTVAQWNSIRKGNNWNDEVPATEVVCSDGVVKLEQP